MAKMKLVDHSLMMGNPRIEKMIAQIEGAYGAALNEEDGELIVCLAMAFILVSIAKHSPANAAVRLDAIHTMINNYFHHWSADDEQRGA